MLPSVRQEYAYLITLVEKLHGDQVARKNPTQKLHIDKVARKRKTRWRSSV